ncbi:MAG: hypothetical protein ACREBI_12030 [Nitrosotalea sp.]
MKILYLSIITGFGIAVMVTLAIVLLTIQPANASDSLTIIMNKQEYGVGEPISFFVETKNQSQGNAFPIALIVNSQNQTVWYDDDLQPNGSKGDMNVYYVSENSENVPMINQTGEYSLFVTYGGQKVYEPLTVTELVNEDGMMHFYGPYQGLDNENGTAQIDNQTYYITTLQGAPSDQTRPNDTTIEFHGVSFTFPGCGKCLTAPMPFNPLQSVKVQFPDNTTETLAVRDNIWSTIGMPVDFHEYFPNGTKIFPNGTRGTWNQIQHRDQIVTTLTQHTGPQAGITVTHDSVKFLVNNNPLNMELAATGKNLIESFPLPPLKQFKSGIVANNVSCRQELELVIKAEDGSPACVKPGTAIKLVARGWGMMTGSTAQQHSIVQNTSTNVCGQFYTAPAGHDSNTVPVLLMKSNSTACVRLTFTIYSNYKDCNGQICQNVIALDTLHIGDLHYEKHDNMFSVSAGKDYTSSFDITTIPSAVDLANYPIGTSFTVTYVIKPLANATGFYDQSIPKLACEIYPLAVGYTADQVNESDFTYIDRLNPPCAAGVDILAGVEISGMTYKQVALQP